MAQFQTVLALDTALNACSAGVYANGAATAESRAMAQGHGEHLLPLIEGILNKSGVEFSDLDALAATAGPGAFTGLRIGLSAAKGLATALDIPLFGIMTTQALAFQYVRQKNPKDNIAVVIETKRQDFYFQPFGPDGSPLAEAASLPVEEIASRLEGAWVVIGDAVERFKKSAEPKFPEMVFDESCAVPDMGLMAGTLAVQGPVKGLFLAKAEPVYLRGADVSSSPKPQRILEIKRA